MMKMLYVQALKDNTMKISTNLPPHVHGVTYVKNTHFIELEDDEGNRTHINATSIVKYECKDCKFIFFALSNHGTISCPLCGVKECAIPVWYEPQLSFVPEKPSKFKGIDCNPDKKKEPV